MMRNILWLCIVLLFAQCKADKGFTDKIKTDEQSTLWKVSGRNLTHPIYLMGTIHLFDTAVFKIPTAVFNRVKACPNLALEMDLDDVDDIKENLKLWMFITDTTQTLDKLMSHTDYNYLKKIAAQRPMMALFGNKLKLIKPFFVMSFLQIPKGKISPDEGVDMQLTHYAQKNKINIHGLETFYQEMKSIDMVPMQEQVKLLTESLNEIDSSDVEMKNLCNLYYQQDLKSLDKEVNKMDLTSAMGQEILIKRNYRFVENAEKYFNDGVFIAVGAGHLCGAEGIINILRAKGYTVEPIDEPFIAGKAKE